MRLWKTMWLSLAIFVLSSLGDATPGYVRIIALVFYAGCVWLSEEKLQ